MYYIYILRCRDHSLYTGITNNINRRMYEHFNQLPQAAKYTRSHPPKRIEAVYTTETKSAAMKLEYRIKQLTKKEKEELLTHPDELSNIPHITPELYQLVFKDKKTGA